MLLLVPARSVPEGFVAYYSTAQRYHSHSTAQTNLQQIGMLQDCLGVAVHQNAQYRHKGKGNLLLHSH